MSPNFEEHNPEEKDGCAHSASRVWATFLADVVETNPNAVGGDDTEVKIPQGSVA
jgi:hypothetical protein